MTIIFWDRDGSVFMSIEGLNTKTEKLDEEDFRNSSIRLMLAERKKPTEIEPPFDQSTQVY
jgi:hypothetical protein